jgi:hypothetical protein
MEDNLTALEAKAEALYMLHMFEESLVLFSRLKRRRAAYNKGSNFSKGSKWRPALIEIKYKLVISTRKAVEILWN